MNTRSKNKWVVMGLAMAMVLTVGAFEVAAAESGPSSEFSFTGEERAEEPDPFEFEFNSFAFFFRLADSLTGSLSPTFEFPVFVGEPGETPSTPSPVTMFGTSDPGKRPIVDDGTPM